MNADMFWNIVEASRADIDPNNADGNMERQCATLMRLLSGMTPGEIVDFRNEFATRMLEIYDFDLWAAAFILGNGCSEDGFADFRSWLISMGREAFESAKKDAETLANVAFLPRVEDIFFEEFQYIPGQAYRDTTGHEIPEYPTPYPDTPRGQWIGDEDAALARRFPRLWETRPSP